MSRLKKTIYTIGCLAFLSFVSLAFLGLRFDSLDMKQAALESREQWSGPVKAIEYELAFIDFEDGTYRESKRSSGRKLSYDERGTKTKDEGRGGDCGSWIFELSITRFDPQGKVVKQSHYHNWYDLFPRFMLENLYDSSSRIVATNEFDSSGKLHRKWTYTYEIDTHGNWTKQTASMWDPKFLKGSTNFVPRQVTYRNISYYQVTSK